MNNFIKQQIKISSCLLRSNFNNPDQIRGGNNESFQAKLSLDEIRNKELTQNERVDIVNSKEIDVKDPEYREFLKVFLKEISQKNGEDYFQRDDVIRKNLSGAERSAFNKVLDLVKAYYKQEQIKTYLIGYSKEELKMLNNFLDNRTSIKTESKDQRQDLSDTIGERGDFKDVETGEKIGEFWGLFSGNTDRLEFYNKEPGVRQEVGKLLREKKHSDLVSIKNKLNIFFAGVKGRYITDSDIFENTNTGDDYYHIGSSNKEFIGPYLNEIGYDFQTSFKKPEELVMLYHTINDVIKLQNDILSYTPEEKISVLFDMDRNGVLEAGNQESANLYQTFNALYIKDKNGFNNLVQNLGLGDQDEVFRSMSENIYSTREKFQRAYNSAIELGYNLTELVVPGKLPEVSSQIADNYNEAYNYIKSEMMSFMINKVDDNSSIVHLPKETKEKFKKDFEEKIDFSSLTLSYINSNPGISTGWNIQEFTNDWLDSFNIGLSKDGGIGLSVSKGLFKKNLAKYGTGISIGITSALQPFLGLSQSISGEISEPEELFDMVGKSSASATFSGSISNGTKVGALNISRIGIDTTTGIEQRINQMQPLLEDLVEQIKDGNTEYKKKGEETTPLEQETYNQMKKAFDRATDLMSDSQKESYSKVFVYGYLSAYRNELYKNAEGFKLTSIGVGVLSIAGFHNLPFIMLGGEKITTSDREVLRDVDRQHDTTETPISLEDIDAEMVEYNGVKNVFRIPKSFEANNIGTTINGEYFISQAHESNSQIKVEGKYIYIGNVGLDNIKIVEHTSGGQLTRSIVIDGGERNLDRTYKSNYEIVDKITNGTYKTLSSLDINENEKSSLNTISKHITNLIDERALKHPQTIGMTALQADIHSFKTNGSPTLEKVWEDYMKVINYSDDKGRSFANYVGKDKSSDLGKLISESESIKSDDAKIYILQTLALALSSKGAITLQENGEYSVMAHDINHYNKERHRDTFFDNIMNNDLPGLASDISQARDEWNQRHGEKAVYNTTTLSGTLALSGTRINRGNNNTLTPITGDMKMIGDSMSDALVEMNNLDNTQKRELLSKAPSYVLENYAEKIGVLQHEVINYIINGITPYGKKIDFTAFFGKNAECINDCIIFDIKIGETKLGVASAGTVMMQENDVDYIGFVKAGELRERDSVDRTSMDTLPTEENVGEVEIPGGEATSGEDTGNNQIGGGFNPNP